ncbi:MAG: hypothetical protein R3B74_09550 [Nitrospirales bacterium]|nr:hypothetical protein [Nitrospirales bacterium]
MAEARINESCIIGLPTCGYAFNSSRMAFVATPSDEEFSLELEVIKTLLKDKQYESYIALQNLDPGQLAFCTKICSKIITSQFCIVLLNSSSHREHPTIKVPNPNVHLEYGLMMAFKKHVLPFQREGDALAFNIKALDTIIYTLRNFKDRADQAIDEAILKTGTTNRPTRALASSETLLRYATVLGLRVTQLNTEEAKSLYALGQSMGYFLLDGKDIVYLGLFDLEQPKEVVFRLKFLLQALHNAKRQFETVTKKSKSTEEIETIYQIWKQLRIEVLVSKEIDKEKVITKVQELTATFEKVPWKIVNEEDIQAVIDNAYDEIGEL